MPGGEVSDALVKAGRVSARAEVAQVQGPMKELLVSVFHFDAQEFMARVAFDVEHHLDAADASVEQGRPRRRARRVDGTMQQIEINVGEESFIGRQSRVNGKRLPGGGPSARPRIHDGDRCGAGGGQVGGRHDDGYLGGADEGGGQSDAVEVHRRSIDKSRPRQREGGRRVRQRRDRGGVDDWSAWERGC